MERNAMTAKGLAAVIAIALIPLFGCDSTSDTRNSIKGIRTDDPVITMKIETRLAAQENPGALTNVHVRTDIDGNVVLTGKVKSHKDADRAVEIARDTSGVRSVTSEIQVEP
jgi:osmotically-inducible protein OsmY